MIFDNKTKTQKEQIKICKDSFSRTIGYSKNER